MRLPLAFSAFVTVGVALFWIVSPAVFHLFFDWPNGGVWANLLASAVLGVPGLYLLLRKMERNHRQHMDLLHLHQAQLLYHLRHRPPRG